MTRRMFPGIPLVGEMTEVELAEKLGAGTAAPEGFLSWGTDHKYRFTSHQFGYIAPLADGQVTGTIESDASLRGAKLIVRLDALHTEEYPGSGEHRVLLTCKALAQIEGASEPIGFSRSYRAQDGRLVSVTGQPIFVGLETGGQGISLECSTVNVCSSGDDAFLQLLEGAPFAKGLELLATAQPVLKPFTEVTVGIAKMLAGRSKNYLVQDFYLGLDFDPQGGGARLRLGSYLAVQVPKETEIEWSEWAYSPTHGGVVAREDGRALPYNYLLFRVSRL
jgi:hypothetical protein